MGWQRRSRTELRWDHCFNIKDIYCRVVQLLQLFNISIIAIIVQLLQ